MSIFRAGAKLGKALLNSAKKVTPKSAKLSTGTGFVAKNSKKLKKTPIPIGQSKKVKPVTSGTTKKTANFVPPKKKAQSLPKTVKHNPPTQSVSKITAKPQGAEGIVNNKKPYIKPEVQTKSIKLTEDIMAPGRLFEETDEAFRNIVRNNMHKYRSLTNKSGDDFIQSAFDLLKKDLGFENSPIKLKIINASENSADLETATIFIGRNWPSTGRTIFNRNWSDESEWIAAIAHEFNHMFQYKEMYINSKFGHLKINNLSKEFANWIDNQMPMFQGHNQYYENKAASYLENFANYKDAPPIGSFKQYSEQLVEAESMKRGNIVGEEFEKLMNKNSRTTIDPLEQLALNKLKNYFIKEYPNIDHYTLQQVMDNALETMQQPKYSNYTVDQFVEYYKNLFKP